MFKVNNKNRSGVFIANFEYILDLLAGKGEKLVQPNFSEKFSFWKKRSKNSSKVGFLGFYQKFNPLVGLSFLKNHE